MNGEFIPQTTEKRFEPFSAADFVYALLALLFGYLFCRAFPFGENPLGAALLLLAVTAFLAVVLARAKAPKGKTILFCGGMALLGLSLFLQADGFVRFGSSMLFGFGFFYALGSCTGLNLERAPGKYFFFDSIRALFVLPYGSFGKLFGALFRKREGSGTGKKIGRTLLYILLGLLVAVFPTLLAIELLKYDAGFADLIEGLLDWNFGDVLSHLGSFLLGIPVAMLLFSGVYRATRRIVGGRSTESADAARKSSKFLPIALSCAVVLPLLAVYALFFFSQREYYLAAFGGRLPEGFVFSEYAREGFFNLCGVAAVNAALLLGLHLFTKKREDGENIAVEKVAAILLSLTTLLLITTAMAKMVLYISAYGLTVSRLFASWFMALLFLGFLAVILRQFVKKLNLTGLLVGLFLLFWAVIALCDWKAIIADYNVNAYLRGDLPTVDVYALNDLDESAVPALCRLVEAEPENRAARWALTESRAYHVAVDDESAWEPGFFGRDLPMLRAKAAVRRALPLPGDTSLDVLRSIRAEILLESNFVKEIGYTWYADGAMICSGGVTPAAEGDYFHRGETVTIEPVIDPESGIWRDPRQPGALTLELTLTTSYGERTTDPIKFPTDAPAIKRYLLNMDSQGNFTLNER